MYKKKKNTELTETSMDLQEKTFLIKATHVKVKKKVLVPVTQRAQLFCCNHVNYKVTQGA